MTPPLRTQKVCDNFFAISLEKDKALTRCALHFLGTLAHTVAHTGRPALDLARAGHAETLFGPAMGLELRHFIFLLLIVSFTKQSGMSMAQIVLREGLFYRFPTEKAREKGTAVRDQSSEFKDQRR
jgi:hypothetical protein